MKLVSLGFSARSTAAPLNFAFILTNLAGGGAQKVMLNLAKLLIDAGHRSTLLLLERRIDYEVPENLPVHVLLPNDYRASAGFFRKRQYAKKLKALVLSLTAGGEPFDAIISTLPFADEICHKAKLNNLWFRIANSLPQEISHASYRKSRVLSFRYKKIYENKNLICVSEGVAREMGTFLGNESKLFSVIYSPIDVEEILREKNKRVRGIPSYPYIVCAARFAPQKRHDLLLKAFEETSLEVRLVLLCDKHPRLEELINCSKRKHDVFVAGFQSNPAPWLAGARLSVLCSDYEGMPNVLVESLACGTPVVSTDCPHGPREILGSEAPNCLVPTGDHHALAAAINRQLKEKFQAIDISRFSKQSALNKLIEVGLNGRKSQ